jgi:hypothetical protein
VIVECSDAATSAAAAGFTPAEALHGSLAARRGRRGLVGERRVPPRSDICRCTGYVNIVEAVMAAGGEK